MMICFCWPAAERVLHDRCVELARREHVVLEGLLCVLRRAWDDRRIKKRACCEPASPKCSLITRYLFSLRGDKQRLCQLLQRFGCYHAVRLRL